MLIYRSRSQIIHSRCQCQIFFSVNFYFRQMTILYYFSNGKIFFPNILGFAVEIPIISHIHREECLENEVNFVLVFTVTKVIGIKIAINADVDLHMYLKRE